MTLDIDNKTFKIYVATLAELTIMPIYPFYEALVALLTNLDISAKCLDFLNIFSSDSTKQLLEHNRINDYHMDLLKIKRLPYGLIYSLEPVELETLKTYIKVNPARSFIRPSKSLAGTPILFVQKNDSSLHLCIDYQGLNNLRIKNQYLLPLTGELLDCLDCAKYYTQLNLTNAYHQMRIQKGDK